MPGMATSICPSRKLDMRRDVSKGFMEPIVGLTPRLLKAADAIVRVATTQDAGRATRDRIRMFHADVVDPHTASLPCNDAYVLRVRAGTGAGRCLGLGQCAEIGRAAHCRAGRRGCLP